MNKPQRKDQLEITKVDEDAMVFEAQSKRVHCLEGPAGLVFAHCDGEHSVEEIAAKVREQNSEMETADVEGILNKFLDLGLLKSSSWTRREVLTRAAALALVYTITAPAPAAAQSVTTTPSGSTTTPPTTPFITTPSPTTTTPP